LDAKGKDEDKERGIIILLIEDGRPQDKEMQSRDYGVHDQSTTTADEQQ
jgi:hypothetical protein